MRALVSLVLACTFFSLACKSRQQNAALQDEGLFVTNGLSLDELVAKISKQKNWDEKKQKIAREKLSTLIPATILFSCGASHLSGFFIDKNGSFVTAAHALSIPRKCFVYTHAIQKGQIEQTRRFLGVDVQKIRNSGLNYDYVVGKTLSYEHPYFLQPSKKSSPKIDDELLALGVGLETFRDGTSSIKSTKKAEKAIVEKKIAASKKTLEAAVDLKKTESYKNLAYNIKLYEIVLKSIDTKPLESYDIVSRYDSQLLAIPLVLTYGVIRDVDGNQFISDNDGMPGFSGGPLLSLNSDFLGMLQGGPSPQELTIEDVEAMLDKKTKIKSPLWDAAYGYLGAIKGLTLDQSIIGELKEDKTDYGAIAKKSTFEEVALCRSALMGEESDEVKPAALLASEQEGRVQFMYLSKVHQFSATTTSAKKGKKEFLKAEFDGRTFYFVKAFDAKRATTSVVPVLDEREGAEVVEVDKNFDAKSELRFTIASLNSIMTELIEAAFNEVEKKADKESDQMERFIKIIKNAIAPTELAELKKRCLPLATTANAKVLQAIR